MIVLYELGCMEEVHYVNMIRDENVRRVFRAEYVLNDVVSCLELDSFANPR